MGLAAPESYVKVRGLDARVAVASEAAALMAVLITAAGSAPDRHRKRRSWFCPNVPPERKGSGPWAAVIPADEMAIPSALSRGRNGCRGRRIRDVIGWPRRAGRSR